MASVVSVLRRAARAMRFARYDHRTVFEHIFKTRYWGDDESLSGLGSSMEQTANIRRELPLILTRFDIHSVFDAPCGDLHWMRDVLAQTDFEYIGADVVPGVVDLARSMAPRGNVDFKVFDIITDPFPRADLWLCRDVLFHLSNSNIFEALKNFAKSEVSYLLVTSHTGLNVVNRNMITGDFRQLNLLKPPYSLPEKAILHRFADYAAPQPARDMLLFRRQDIADSLLNRTL